MTTLTACTLRNTAPVVCVALSAARVFAADPPISAGKNYGSMDECNSMRHADGAEHDTEATADWLSTKEASATGIEAHRVNAAVKSFGSIKTEIQHDKAVSQARMIGGGITGIASGLNIGAAMT